MISVNELVHYVCTGMTLQQQISWSRTDGQGTRTLTYNVDISRTNSWRTRTTVDQEQALVEQEPLLVDNELAESKQQTRVVFFHSLLYLLCAVKYN